MSSVFICPDCGETMSSRDVGSWKTFDGEQRPICECGQAMVRVDPVVERVIDTGNDIPNDTESDTHNDTANTSDSDIR